MSRAFHRFVRASRNVHAREEVIQSEQWVIHGRRLFLEDVQSCRGNPPLRQRLIQRALVDQTPTCCVD